MEYSDEENLRWWKLTSFNELADLLAEVAEKATAPRVRMAVERLSDALNRKRPADAADVAVVRKWARG